MKHSQEMNAQENNIELDYNNRKSTYITIRSMYSHFKQIPCSLPTLDEIKKEMSKPSISCQITKQA